MSAVVFIHRGGPEAASYRYRAEVPAKYVGATINEGPADIVVFSKPILDDVVLAKDYKSKGAKVVVDLCDPLFKERPQYEEICKIADKCVVPTAWARDIVGRYTTRSVAIIPDPYEFDEVKPHAGGSKFLWFGHNANLDDIRPYATKVDDLRVISGPLVGDGITHYSRANLERAFAESNLCLFPTRKGAEYKSPNRFVNAVRQGLFPICHPHPSYNEFKGLAWIGEIETGVRFALHEGDRLNPLVAQMQDMVREKYSPETVGGLWKDLLNSI